jgi:hypothetical protein
MFKRKHDRERIEANSDSEALDYGLAALKWMLLKHTKKTVLALLVLLGSSLYVIIDYYSKLQFHKQKVEQMEKAPK